MASKRFLLFPAALLCFFFALTFVDASEDEESDDPMTGRRSISENFSGKTDAELFSLERELQQSLGKDPGNADLEYRLSNVYATLFDRTRTQKGRQSTDWLMKSRDALEKTLMIRPNDKVAHYNLGVVNKRLGKMERAREELKKAIRLCDPQRDVYLMCSSWLQIGAIYEEQGFFDEAKEAYLKANELDYGNEDIKEALRNVDVKRKSPEKGGGSSPFSGIPSMGSSFSTNPQTAAAMGQDPNAQNAGGVAQALPALGQMLMQKFGGGNSGGTSNDSQQ